MNVPKLTKGWPFPCKEIYETLYAEVKKLNESGAAGNVSLKGIMDKVRDIKKKYKNVPIFIGGKRGLVVVVDPYDASTVYTFRVLFDGANWTLVEMTHVTDRYLVPME